MILSYYFFSIVAVNRKTLLKKYRDISEKLAVLDRQDLLPYERAVAIDSIQRDIAATW